MDSKTSENILIIIIKFKILNKSFLKNEILVNLN